MYAQDTVTANAIFSDEEMQVFLDQNGSNIFLAAADALDIIASNQVYTLKVMSNNGLSTNGASVANALHTQAEALRQKAITGLGSTDAGIIIVPNADDPYLSLR